MNVAELIAKLSDLDPSLRVVVNGYETGFDVIKTLQQLLFNRGSLKSLVHSVRGKPKNRWSGPVNWSGANLVSKLFYCHAPATNFSNWMIHASLFRYRVHQP